MKLRSILSTVVEFSSWQWVLIDFVWQFQTRAADVILAHQWKYFPGVRSLPTLHNGGRQISWRGANSRRTLKFYDKARHLHAGAGVLRVELRLAGAELRKHIDENAPLDFAELWRVYRSELAGLSPVELPEARKHGIPEAVASLPPEAQSKFLLAYQQERTAHAVSDFKRKLSAADLRKIPWNWRDQLPADSPPPPVNVEPRRRHRNKTPSQNP